jgi:large subunit ribosomal protein L2
MGKRIRVQRRGRGTSTFKASTHKRVAPVQYPSTTEKQREAVVRGEIKEIVHESGRGAPLASVELETGETYHTIIPEGVFEGQQIQIGSRAVVDVGNVLPLGKMPEGTMICNIELSPDDGGKMARSSGSYAMVGQRLALPLGRVVLRSRF